MRLNGSHRLTIGKKFLKVWPTSVHDGKWLTFVKFNKCSMPLIRFNLVEAVEAEGFPFEEEGDRGKGREQ
jgi:hypothetical protein